MENEVRVYMLLNGAVVVGRVDLSTSIITKKISSTRLRHVASLRSDTEESMCYFSRFFLEFNNDGEFIIDHGMAMSTIPNDSISDGYEKWEAENFPGGFIKSVE